MHIGSTSITALYLGSTAISTVYLGATQVYSAGGAFTPASLFASGEEGAWYEPSPTTCFTDTTASTAATYGNAVQYLEDLSGNGNHATQTTLASRPILARVPETGRRNLLERTEEFDNAYWSKIRSSVNSPASLPYIVTCTATETRGSGVINDGSAASLANTDYTVTARVKYVDNPWVVISILGDLDGGRTWFNIQTGDVGSSITLGTGSIVGAPSITAVGDGSYDCTFSFNTGTNGTGTFINGIYLADADGTFDSTATRQFEYYRIQLELGSTATAYQKVVDEYDITEAGVTSLDYLSFDGADDGMATASIDFTSTDKMSVFAGVRKLTAKDEVVVEASADFTTNNGTFILSSGSTGINYFGGRGTSFGAFTSTSSLPSSSFQTVQIDLLGATKAEEIFPRVNGAIPTLTGSGNPNLGTGNFGNYPLNIGARNNKTSLFFDGHLYGLIVRGASSATEEITNTEAYLAAKSGVTL